MDLENWHALYNDNVIKIDKKAAQENSAKENLNFWIDLAIIAMVAEDIKSTEDEPQSFNKAWKHSNLESQRKGQEAIQKEFGGKNISMYGERHKTLMPLICMCDKNK